MRIPRKVAGSVSYLDLFGAGLVKYVEERALSGVIGNGTIKSGAIKLLIGALSRRFAPRGVLADSVSIGFAVDGMEDILTALIGGGMIPFVSGGNSGDEW